MTAPLRFFDFDKYGLEINHIYNEDCLEGMKKIKDKSVDMILCDLPYGTTDCKWDSIIPLEKLWEQYERIVKDDGAIVLTATQPFASLLVSSNLKLFKYDWIWEKDQGSNFINVKNEPLKKHESVLVFSKGTIANKSKRRMKYNPQGLISCEIKKTNANKRKDGGYLGERENFSDGEYKQEFKNYPSTILKYKRDRGLHPTQKPVEMFEYLIRTYTEPGAVVLDNCMGSGTTAVACVRSGRNFIGFENDTEHGYYETAMQRIKEVWHENRSH
jgi:site-specific DNA-methyltransferase (adenine-specific)